MSKPLKGHSPRAYSRDVMKFKELLNQCSHVSFVGPGPYCNIGARKYHIIFKPANVPHMLVARFQDGQAAYAWHLVVKETSVYACAQEIESVMRAWKPEITAAYRGFSSEERSETMTDTNDNARVSPSPHSERNEHCQNGQSDDDALSETIQPSDLTNHAQENDHEPQETLAIAYNWIPIDSQVYHALAAEARESHNGTAEVLAACANFVTHGLHSIIKSRTGLKDNKKITKALKRLQKAGIWIELDQERSYPYSRKLRFVEDVPKFPDQTRETPAQSKPVEPVTPPPAPQTNGTVVIPAVSSLQEDIARAVFKTIENTHDPLRSAYDQIADAYADIVRKVAEYNRAIEWSIAAFDGMLTPEQIFALRGKKIE